MILHMRDPEFEKQAAGWTTGFRIPVGALGPI